MSASFDGSVSNFVANQDPVLTYPFSLGFWAQPAVASTLLGAWVYMNGTTDAWHVTTTAASQWAINSTQASTLQTTSVTTITVTAGVWYYVVARFISATNRRISVYQNDGTIGSAQNTTSSTPVTPNAMNIGRNGGATSNRWNGLMAEAWLADGDIQPDGLALNQNTLQQLAFYGPLSVPSIITPKNLVYYLSFLPFYRTLGVIRPDVKSNRGISWAPSSMSFGINPPLPSGYRRPDDQIRTGIV